MLCYVKLCYVMSCYAVRVSMRALVSVCLAHTKVGMLNNTASLNHTC